MKQNERGSTLVIVLLVILIFSVLGLTVMGNVVGENKRVNVTESDVQWRNLAESGLTYFEKSFNNYVTSTDPSNVNINTFLDGYRDFKPIDPSKQDGIMIKAEPDPNNGDGVIVTSKVGTNEKALIGHYMTSFDIQVPTIIIPNFPPGGKAIDFSKISVLDLGIGNIITANLINLTGDINRYYTVPNDKVIGVNALGPILGLNLGNNFETMENNRVIAMREGGILSADVLKSEKGSLISININVLDYKDIERDLTNVIINGTYTSVSLLGLLSLDGYKDIRFLKLAVMGNTIIQQDPSDLVYHLLSPPTRPTRNFSFTEGLYVNKTLVIGGSKDVSNLELHGNLLAMGDVLINNVNLITGNKSHPEAIYSHGDVTITNACINKNANENSDLRVYTTGKIIFQGDTNCTTFNGLFYAEQGVKNQMNKKVTINGGMIGPNLTPEKITYNPDPRYLNDVKQSYNKLIPKGRSFN